MADAQATLADLITAVQSPWKRIAIMLDGRPAAVLMSVADLETLLETLEVLSDPETVAAIREVESGGAQMTTGDEMAEMMARRRNDATV